MSNKKVLFAVVPAVAVAGYYFFPGSVPTSRNLLETNGVQNIGNAWSSGGGSQNHTPGVATRRGSSSDTVSRQEKDTGVGSPEFDEKVAAQKVGKPGKVAAAFNQAHLGNDKGK